MSTANLSYRQIGELLVTAVGREHPVRSAPMGLFRAVGKGNRLVRDISLRFDPDDALIPENVELMARELYYAPDRAVRELGIPQVSTHELIAEFVR